MVDKIDVEIMLALSKDGRCSYTDLANKLGIEGITVAKRIRSLLKNDVIGIRAVPNRAKMGYKVMACMAMDVDRSKIDTVSKVLVGIPNISNVLVMFGKYDIIVFSEYHDISEMYLQIRKTISRIKGVKSIETFMIIDDMEKYQPLSSLDTSSDKRTDIDEIDEALINELRKDGRVKFAILAKRLKIGPATVARRVRTLVRNNVIQITVLANPTKFHNYVLAFLGLQVESKKMEIICARLFDYPQTSSVYTLSTGFNILHVVSFPDLQALSRFVTNDIASIDGVLDIEILIRAEFRKGTYLKFNIEETLQDLLVNNS